MFCAFVDNFARKHKLLDHKVTNSVTPKKAAQSTRAQTKGKSQSLLELEIKHKHGGFNINDEKATVV
jgi:hypothetical protein